MHVSGQGDKEHVCSRLLRGMHKTNHTLNTVITKKYYGHVKNETLGSHDRWSFGLWQCVDLD